MKVAHAMAVMWVVAATAGCQFEASQGIKVSNDTTRNVVVKLILSDGTLTAGATLIPGATMFAGQSGCTITVRLRAFSPEGELIQANDGLCADDTWHITATPATTPTTPTATTPTATTPTATIR